MIYSSSFLSCNVEDTPFGNEQLGKGVDLALETMSTSKYARHAGEFKDPASDALRSAGSDIATASTITMRDIAAMTKSISTLGYVLAELDTRAVIDFWSFQGTNPYGGGAEGVYSNIALCWAGNNELTTGASSLASDDAGILLRRDQVTASNLHCV